MSHICIIEDDAAIAEIERDYLEINGFTVSIATDGVSGLNLAQTESFDLILLDLMLPQLDGFTLCRKLRERLDIPILMVTAKKEDIDKIRGLGLGAENAGLYADMARSAGRSAHPGVPPFSGASGPPVVSAPDGAGQQRDRQPALLPAPHG